MKKAEQEDSSQNMIPVYSTGGGIEEPVGQFDISGDELRRFLLNENLFTPAYIEKNRSFIGFLEASGLPFNLSTMVRYIEHKKLKDQILSPATVRNRKYQMKRICAELVKMSPERWSSLDQFVLDTFFHGLKTGTRQSKAVSRERILSRKEIERLLKNAPEVWRLILLFLATTGVRVGEMVTIIRPRCAAGREEVRITLTGKGNKQRTVICPKKLYSRICEVFPSKRYLFCTTRGTKFDRRHIWRGCNRLGQRILGRPVGVHTFRHSLATHMIEDGVELKRVSDYLGHSDTTITNDMYVHLESISISDIPAYGDY